jgi:hypothetical protein
MTHAIRYSATDLRSGLAYQHDRADSEARGFASKARRAAVAAARCFAAPELYPGRRALNAADAARMAYHFAGCSADAAERAAAIAAKLTAAVGA